VTSRPLAIPGLSSIPLVGSGLFDQPTVTYCMYLLIPLLWWWMYRTHSGLALRAIGDAPAAAEAAGVRVNRVRVAAILFGGATGGLAGAALVLAQAGTFAENMSAGRGFIAIAIVVLGRWHPGGVALAALLFGAASALQFLLQALGLALPYELFLALPYVLTLAALAGVAGKVRAPAALARIDDV
jgi:simple sugar transport system permease protein